MQDLTGKIDATSGADGSLGADQWNQFPTEVQNIITALGQALSAFDLNQLGKSIAGYVAHGDFYSDIGSADTYVLSAIGGKQTPPTYSDGMSIRFIPNSSNTGASTINVGGLGAVALKSESGGDLQAGSIFENIINHAEYNEASNEFRIKQRDLSISVENTTSLELQEPTIDGQIFNTRGHTVTGKGGNSYRYDASDTTSTDDYNGAVVVVTAGGHRLKTIKDRLNSFNFGMIGDGITDDLAGYTAMCNYCSDTGDTVTVKSADVKYTVSRGPALYSGFLSFESNAVISNTANDNTNFWNNTALFVGSYFGYDADHGINGETPYQISDVGISDKYITLETLSDADNFSVGDVIYLKDANNYGSTDFAINSHVTEVLAIDGAVITMRDSTPVAITSDGATKPDVRIATNSIVPPSNIIGIPQVARLARNVGIINGQFESVADTYSQVVHVACHDSELDFKYVKGSQLFGINPCSYTKINLRNGLYQLRAFELAYHHSYVSVDYFKASRFSLPKDGTASEPAFSISEYGNNFTFLTIDIDDEDWLDDDDNACVSFTAPINIGQTIKTNGSQNTSVSIGANSERCEGTIIDQIVINGSSNNGLSLDSHGVTIKTLNVDGLPSTGRAAVVRDGVFNSSIMSGALGSGQGSGSQYKIEIEDGVDADVMIGNVTNHYSQKKAINKSLFSTTGTTSDEVIHTYTVPQNTSTRNSEWLVEFMGNIANSSTDTTKTVSIVVNGTAIASLSFTVAQTGYFNLSATLSKGQANDRVDYIAHSDSNHSTSDSANSLAINTNSNDLVVEVIFNSGVTSTLNSRSFKVTPSLDQVF